MLRSYSELITIDSYEERFKYLTLSSKELFGYKRYLNQAFYQSDEWRRVRDKVIIRDDGCDLAFSDYEIFDRIYVHHINPITIQDIKEWNVRKLFDMDNLVCTSTYTHEAIHHGKEEILTRFPIERKPGDMKLW